MQRMLTYAQPPVMLQTLENVVIWSVFGGLFVAIVDLEVAGSSPVGHPDREVTKIPSAEAFHAYPGVFRVWLPNDAFCEKLSQ